MTRPRQLALAGAVLCAVAALFSASALYVPGIALLLVAALAPAWVWLATLRARIELEPVAATAYEGERVAVTIGVRRGPLRVGGAGLRLGDIAVALPSARASVRVGVSAVAERRGRQPVGPACLRLTDPFGICVRELRSEEHELLVLPRVYPVSAGTLERVQHVSVRSRRSDSQLHLDSLRAYDASGPASRIHWPTVARTGELMAREFVAESDPRVLVVVDARLPASDEALDRALRACASLCVHLARHGGCQLLLPGEARPRTIGPALEGWPAVHARLALVREGTPTASGAWTRGGRTIVYVTAARSGAALGATWRVGPHPLPGAAVAFDVAGCAGQLHVNSALREAA